jgi:ATP-dependent RNA helicase DeaD
MSAAMRCRPCVTGVRGYAWQPMSRHAASIFLDWALSFMPTCRHNAETLLHRSGRTGRAGRKGVSALIVPGRARRKAERLLQGAKVQAEWADPPSVADVLARDEERLLSDSVWQEALTDAEREFAGKLLASYSPEQIAAGYLRLHNARVSAPEELSAPEKMASSHERKRDRGKSPREQQPFGESVWFSVSIGRSRKAEPRWLLPMLCRAGNITAKVIGAIRVQEAISFVEIQAQSVDGFVAAVGPQMQLESGVRLTRLDGPPDLSATNAEPEPQPERSHRKPPSPGKFRPKSGSKPKPKSKWQPNGERAEDPKPKRKLKKGGKQPAKFKAKTSKPGKPKPRDRQN